MKLRDWLIEISQNCYVDFDEKGELTILPIKEEDD